MIKFSEFVSLGHPDKIADYISQYLLDRYIEHDPQTRYAVEVQIKGYQVTLGGEVSSKHHLDVYKRQRLEFVNGKLGLPRIGIVYQRKNEIALNDGLSFEDWENWFKNYDLAQPMAIIHFTKFRY